MMIRVWFSRLAGVAAVFAAALMGIQDLAAQEFEEIVVTARKRDESVLEIPISVSAYTQEDLDALGMNTLEQLASVTPGFVFQTIGAGGFGGRYNPSIRFRGLGVQQATPASRAGAVFWKGGYISDGAGILPLMDLERIEVLKGPQTAFFGRNTFAGAVNYIPATPGDEFSGKASLSYSASDESSHSFTGAIGGPISDRVGVRIALNQERVGADWQFDNGDPLNEENTTAVTATLAIRGVRRPEPPGHRLCCGLRRHADTPVAGSARGGGQLQPDLLGQFPLGGHRPERHQFHHRSFAVSQGHFLREHAGLGRDAHQFFRSRQHRRQHTAFLDFFLVRVPFSRELESVVLRNHPAAGNGRRKHGFASGRTGKRIRTLAS